MLIGANEKNYLQKPLGIKWPAKVKALGVYFSHDKFVQEKSNFGQIIPDIEI